MFHTVYKTTNLANGKYYFGVHKTENPNDSYLGSGKYIKAAIAKYGELGFRKEVLFVYLDPESAFAKEDELIQCYRGLDPLCMNLRKGGSGGFDWINRNMGIDYRSRGQKANSSYKMRFNADESLRRAASFNLAIGRKKSALNRFGNTIWVGRHHGDATKKLMSEKAKLNNPQLGKCWITRFGINKSIKKEDLPQFVANGWKKGRIFGHVG